MNNFFELIGWMVTAIGGAGVLIIGVSAFISRFWADWFMKRKTAKYDKEIEKYKSELNFELEKLKTKNESVIYRSKVQFDLEIEIYRKLFDELYDFTNDSYSLYPTFDTLPFEKEEQQALFLKRYEKYVESFNSFNMVLAKNAPFIPKKIYDMFCEIRKLSNSLSILYHELKLQTQSELSKDGSVVKFRTG